MYSFILFLLNKLDLCVRFCKETLQSFNPCKWIRWNETDKEAFVSYLGFCPVWWSWSRGGNKPRCISLTWFPFSYAHLKRKQTHTHAVWWHREKYSDGPSVQNLPLSDFSQILPLFFFFLPAGFSLNLSGWFGVTQIRGKRRRKGIIREAFMITWKQKDIQWKTWQNMFLGKKFRFDVLMKNRRVPLLESSCVSTEDNRRFKCLNATEEDIFSHLWLPYCL